MFNIKSTSSCSKKFLATFSSFEKVSIAYIPGRSTILISLKKPSFLSTVTPGQFPTYCFEPVKALNNVVLPTLGLPRRAIVVI